MKSINYSLRHFGVMTGVAGLLLSGFFTTELRSAESKGSRPMFSSAEEAVKALETAAGANDRDAMHALFGPEFRELLTGDQVLDQNHAKQFADAVTRSCTPVNESADKIILEIGTNKWPMPIPLVKNNGKWYFDTAAGKEEIINRHIGKDELHAIGVCRAYVNAQRQFAKGNSGSGGEPAYARKFKSSPGKKDGLYWPVVGNEPESPFGPLVADAHAEGYVTHKDAGPHPFHGYYFRILTSQGPAAPGGKMRYESRGELTRGFALVAYPERWDHSGIMTFIVNQDGKIFQQDLGEKTARIAAGMKEYNPDNHWTAVHDEGVSDAVTER